MLKSGLKKVKFNPGYLAFWTALSYPIGCDPNTSDQVIRLSVKQALLRLDAAI